MVFNRNIIRNMIKRLFYGFLGAYAFFVTINPFIYEKCLTHWENIKYSTFLSIGVMIGLMIDYILKKKKNNEITKEKK